MGPFPYGYDKSKSNSSPFRESLGQNKFWEIAENGLSCIPEAISILLPTFQFNQF